MKKIILIFTFLFLIASVCSAETIYLKNGRAIKGKIVEKKEGQVKIDANGMMLTYYVDEIDRIEGEVTSQLAAPQAPLTKSPLIEQSSSPSVSGTAENSSTNKKELILKYIEATGAKANMQKTFDDIVNTAAEDKKANLRQALNLDDILNELVPVYDQYFTAQDLKELIVFYESPIAKKLFKVEPLLLKDIMEKSRQYLEGKIE